MKNWWGFGDEGLGEQGVKLNLSHITCGFCGDRGRFKIERRISKSNESSGKTLHYDTLKCENCGNYTFAFWSAHIAGSLYSCLTLPYPISEVTAPKHWPEKVQNYWKQAHKALKTESWDAATLMARSALQVVMREQTASGGNLFKEIADLHSKGILPQIMRDFADELRILANTSAHPSPTAGEVTQKDAEDIVEFLDILLDYIYNLPKKINDYRNRKNTP